MTFYISCRYFPYENSMISPKELFKKCFVGINFSAKLIAQNRAIDGRLLYEIELSDSYNESEANELKSVFIEALTMFGAHLKTQSSALALAELLSGKNWQTNGSEKIELVP